MTARIAFRVDSSHAIGTGHVVRCLTLADALARRGASCHFVCRDLSGAVPGLIAASGYSVTLLSSPSGSAPSSGGYAAWLGVGWEQDAAETAAALTEEPDWLVVDHYALDRRWETAVRGPTARMLAIDDLANRQHDCDILLDQQAIDRMEARYSDLIPEACRALIGPRFALLKPQFASHRQAGLKDRTAPVSRLLVFFGGADTPDLSSRTIAALDDIPGVAVDLVIGLANPHAGQIAEAAAARRWLTLHPGDSDMAALMTQADLMIGGAGTTTWERCALGLPAIAVAMAENQIAGAEHVARAGAMLYLGSAEDVTAPAIAGAVATLVTSPWQRAHMAAQAAGMVDGRGADRVAAAMLGGGLQVRLAQADDAERVLLWRNAPATRAVSASSDEIEPADHRAWFARVLADDSRHLLIGEQDGHPAGVVRFDCEGNGATVSIFLAPERIGEALGGNLLAAGIDWLVQNAPDCQWVDADVKADHAPSHRLFLDSGFALSVSRYRRMLR